MADPVLPGSLKSLYDSSSPEYSSLGYDPIHLSESECLSLLRLPLARKVFGHEPIPVRGQGDANGEVQYGNPDANGSSTFTNLITSRMYAIISSKSEDGHRSELLHIGLAALSIFLQLNVTGPPLPLTSRSISELVIPTSSLGEGGAATDALSALRQQMVRGLSVDGETIYPLTPHVELFCAAKAILTSEGLLQKAPAEGAAPLAARTAKLRANFLHQKLLGENVETLQTLIYEDLEVLGSAVLESKTKEERAKFLLERATIHTHHGFDAKARADLEHAARENGFEFALTGRLGKKTKFQDRDITQLVVLAKNADGDISATTGEMQIQGADPSKPANLDLNDDTLLESISFKEEEPSTQDKATTLQDESSLSPKLASLDPSNQPILNPLDSVILLSIASAITNTSPQHGLTREETLPYATRVLNGGSSNWQIYTQALLLRSRIEGYRSRTIERGVLQMQALVDQVIADTASDSKAVAEATGESTEPTTFLPRPETSESASASERLQYIWQLNFSTRWDLETELASRWVSLGALRTALDIYERLQLWAEVALCYAATDREGKARIVVRKQLYRPTNNEQLDEDVEQFQGPEISPLPADAPRLFCILGDIDQEPSMYERAWTVSNSRYARAQRSLARHYLSQNPPSFIQAEDAYQKSLQINRLNHSTWFSLGCVQLELEQFEEAVASFTRTVQLEESDAESWSNLAVALLRVPPRPVAVKAVEDEAESESQPSVEPPNPHKFKHDALRKSVV